MAHDHHHGIEEKRLHPATAAIGFVATGIICLVLGFFVAAYSGVRPVGENEQRTGAGARGDFDSTIVPVGDSPVWGSVGAPVTVVLFSDFGCPYCKRTSQIDGALGRIKRDYSGDQVRIVYKHHPLPFHQQAPAIHKASIAAHNQGKFWEYHDEVFRRLRFEKGNSKTSLSRKELIDIAAHLQLNTQRFVRDLASPATARALAQDLALVKRLNAAQKVNNPGEAPIVETRKLDVGGTPSFLINGRSVSNNYGEVRSVINDELARFRRVTSNDSGNCYYVYAVNENTRGLTVNSLNTNPTPVAAAAPPPAPTGPVFVDTKGSPFKGAADAPVTIVELSDFQCPFCSRVNPTIDQVMKTYPGKVKVVFKHLPLPFHKDAPLAAEASLAANAQGKFWEYHDKLFANQKALKRSDLDRYAQELGLNMAQFKADLDTGKHKAAVDKDLADAKKAGVNGTPNFLINGQAVKGAQPFEAFKAVIDAKLAEAGK